jgi:hypothetical protein
MTGDTDILDNDPTPKLALVRITQRHGHHHSLSPLLESPIFRRPLEVSKILERSP